VVKPVTVDWLMVFVAVVAVVVVAIVVAIVVVPVVVRRKADHHQNWRLG
jgi:membrane protein YdbS with pleckstrin-like domain